MGVRCLAYIGTEGIKDNLKKISDKSQRDKFFSLENNSRNQASWNEFNLDNALIQSLENYDKIKKKLLLGESNLTTVLTTAKKAMEHVGNSISKITVYEEASLFLLSELSLVLCGCGNYYDEMTDDEKNEFTALHYFIIIKAYESLGYWIAKLEQAKKNRNNVKTRTMDKEKHKAELKKWMKTMKPKDYRLRAQKEFEKTDRTILKYLQEIRDEETAILRKENVSA